ncbi:MAG: Glycosyl transferase group 1 [Candidatus Uhrbacteria bacterium GW2011_GWE2_40_58]|nr:MAG: Glycosyl transferase group 1 [Candidatus Uhrbacteria bacterium GW2011_GWF2_40_263]KKR66884.1 MAG: Glycosyl transferase group 1 [Candidatus Uhrbacteria bacterium GW2011_GWE2_40_58]OGL93832.1 MAG: hypothetical protein A2239_04010 [Candidatus Uhrbacteria bacterium RIFOXYA2_FULL_40_9]OGL97976.1 MAG: hypothetical protein A2332_00550 [Candidatus Uhrbacteria bacterium RIFOXYB2_FULL_41_18]HBK35250.1 hypothetical protein [Candidatus Uhrbacteria bacterium]
MKIAIDGTTLCDTSGGRGAGIEHYTWSMVSFLLKQTSEHQYFLVVPANLSQSSLQELVQGCAHVKVLRSWFPKIRLLSRHIFLPLKLYFFSPDVLFSPSGQIPLGWIGKSVITIHDLAIYEHPEWFDQVSSQAFAIQTVVPKSIAHAQAIITVSQTTQQQLEKLFPIAKGKSRVIYEGAETPKVKVKDLISDRFPFDRDYVLFLGTLEPRKNIEEAILAFNHFLSKHPDQVTKTRFILAGKLGWSTEKIQLFADEVNAQWKEVEPDGVVQALGSVTEQEKWLLLARASAFLFPSLFEGFGLPILEAMSAGVPVITTKCGAIPEIGGDAVIYVEPDNREQMSFAIAQTVLVPEGAYALREAGIERAKLFTWQQAAQETLEVLEDVGKKHKES